MSMISLTSGFQVVPEGTHVFLITGVNYDAQFGKMSIKLATKDGIKHEERYFLLDNNSQPNDKAMNAFSYFAKVATQNYENRDIDTDELVGCYIGATVTHNVQPNKNNPEKTVTFARLSDYFEANGFEGDDSETQTPSAPATAKDPAPSRASVLAALGL